MSTLNLKPQNPKLLGGISLASWGWLYEYRASRGTSQTTAFHIFCFGLELALGV